MSEAFTPAQETALKQAWLLLTEHFDHVNLSVVTDHSVEDAEVSTHYWRGGRMTALGLAIDLQRKLFERQPDSTEPL